jgi:hypothetical protein
MTTKSKLITNLALLLIFSLLPLFADHEIKGSVTMYADSSEYWEEIFILKGSLGVEFDLAKGMEAEVTMYIDDFEVNPDEITIKMKLGDSLRLRGGYKENFMTFDEYYSSFDRLINETGLITEYYDYLGYVARYVGLEAYDKKDWYVKGGISNVFPYEPQANATYFFHPFGEDSYYGISGLYLGNYRTISVDEGDNAHYFAFTLHAADSLGPWLYSSELAFGSNISSPISYMTLPTDADDTSYFLGFDAILCREIYLKEMRWLPGVRYSRIAPDVAYAEYYIQRATLGNQLYMTEDAKIFFDVFLEHERPYLDISGEEDEYTLGIYIGIQVKTN